MELVLLPEAEAERRALPAGERAAMNAALEKLRVLGDGLAFPHSSDIRGAIQLRELRPRAGRSPWRAFYRRIGAVMVVGAIGPEANAGPRRFRHTVAAAEERLEAWEREQER